MSEAESARDDARSRLSEKETSLAETLLLLSTSRSDLAEAQRELERAGDVEALRAELSEARQSLSAAEQAQLVQIAATQALRERLKNLDAERLAAESGLLAEAAAAEALRDRLKNADSELTAMTLNLEAQRKKAEETLTLLAAARAANTDLENSAQITLTESERRAALLAQANERLAEEEARSASAERRMALLNEQTVDLRQQLARLQGLLDLANAKDAESQVQIDALGRNLNSALAQVAAEKSRVAEEQRKLAEEQRKLAEEQAKLAEEQRLRAELEEAERVRLEEEAKDLRNYRSEFFGRVRQILGQREGIEVQGDRFVFSSEVLFAPGSAQLGIAGRQQISRVAAVLREVAAEVPPEINWILRVDGHTDKSPLGFSSPFSDNWELSQARALSVVRYLTEFEGIPTNRLAATGFGEWQPIDPGNTPQALARNRRIELKFTEK